MSGVTAFYGAFKPALLVEEDAYHKLKIGMTDDVEADRAWQAGVQKAVGGRVRPRSSF